MSFILIRDIRDLAKRKLPSTIPAGHDILIDVAAAHQLGRILTMKQLLLMRGGSATTLRRRLNLLIDAGYVVKVPNARDARSDHYSVTKTFLKKCASLDAELKKISVEFDRRHEKRRTSETHDAVRKIA